METLAGSLYLTGIVGKPQAQVSVVTLGAAIVLVSVIDLVTVHDRIDEAEAVGLPSDVGVGVILTLVSGLIVIAGAAADIGADLKAQVRERS